MKQIFELTPVGVLRALFWLRCLAIGAQALAVAAAYKVLSMQLPIVPIVVTIVLLGCWNALVYGRLKQSWPVTHAEILLKLSLDALALTVLLYFAGGATNPFVSLYLVPIAITAAALPGRYVWAMLAMCTGMYSFLMLFYTSLPPIHGHFGGDFSVHVIGMWINFLMSAVLMSIFVAAIASAVRQRDLVLARAREQALTDEKIVALGTLASGVAHEISTPLSTMTLLVDEMLDQPQKSEPIRADLELLGKQIAICRNGVASLLDRAGHNRSEHARRLPLKDFIGEITSQWQTIRPEIEVTTNFEQPFDNPEILAEQTIGQALTNLLNNAADASAENQSRLINLRFASRHGQLRIFIDDNGPGISARHAGQPGQAVVSTKADGLGIGLILSNATISRFGGEVHLRKRADRGTRTEIVLPLNKLVLS